MPRLINWRKYGLLIGSLPVVATIFAASAYSGLLVPHDPYYLDVLYMLEGPSSEHLLGTDEMFDLKCRLVANLLARSDGADSAEQLCLLAVAELRTHHSQPRAKTVQTFEQGAPNHNVASVEKLPPC